MVRLTRDFFARSTLEVAPDLLNRTLIFGVYQGLITETEAYIGKDDPACHAARGLTPRTKVMFGPPGFSYVYFIYGMYHCLNIVTEEEGFPAAVLIRSLDVQLPTSIYLNGPGKLCRHLGITTREHNVIDLITSKYFYVAEGSGSTKSFKATSRIGISKGQDKLWRFILEDKKNNDGSSEIRCLSQPRPEG